MSTETPIDYLSMSDEDVAKMTPPEAEAPAAAVTETPPAGATETPAAGATVGGDATAGVEGGDGQTTVTETSTNPAPAGEVPGAAAAVTPPAGEPAKPAVTESAPAPVATAGTMAETLATAISQGIQANGKKIELRSAEEAIRLIQMGANYTVKMQQLSPALRIVKMLENNNLLDETKVSHLIDLDQKNPGAIQKLLADSKFDPLSADKAAADSYKPGEHGVSDAEMRFNQAVDDLIELPGGSEFLGEITKQWDPASKQALWDEPVLLDTLNRQRANGMYATITGEIQRLTVLGQIPAGTPFLQAYKAVGDMLHEQGKLVPATPAGSTETPPATITPPVVTPPQTPATPAGPSAEALAAGPVRGTTTKPGQPTPNFLAQSDEEFLKSMAGRL